MKRFSWLVLALAVSLTGCNKENGPSDPGKEKPRESTEDIVLQQRDPSLSTVVTKGRRTPSGTRSVGYLPAEKYLGYSYNIGNSDIGDNVNVRHAVIDIERLEQKYSTYVAHHTIRASDRGQQAYSDYDRYVEAHSKWQKIKSGFQLNLGAFKFGRKKEVETRFTTFQFEENNESLGEYWFEIYHGRHTMQRNSAATRNISSGFLHTDFLDALYNAPKTELLDDYGPFVITDYYTGGRAYAMFYGLHHKKETVETRERKTGTEIQASVTWTDKSNNQDTVAGSLTIGKHLSDSTSIFREYKNFQYSVKTRGGSTTIDTPSQPVVGNPLNLTAWLQSLNDTKTHTLSGFVDQGLSFIGDFLLEENFREILQDTHMEKRYLEEHVLPRMEILKVFVRTAANGESLYEVAPILRLRENEWLIMSDPASATATDAELKANNNSTTFMAKARAIAAEKSQYYQCEIITNDTKTINPILRKPLSFQVKGLDESRMKKFYNPDTDMYYIYDSVALVAFAYYMDDYILESYGLLEWAENLPEKAISMTNLAQRYRIFGL